MKDTTKRESGTPPRGPYARGAASVESGLPPKAVSRWMSEQGKKGGAKSRRVLTAEQARSMVEAKKSAIMKRAQAKVWDLVEG